MRGDYRRRKDGRLDWRVLVVDKETKVTLESILTVDEIIAENIVQIEDIADEERSPSDFSAIYLLSSAHGEEFILRSLKKEFKGEFAPKMFFQEVIGTDKFSTNHFLHNGVKRALENSEPDTSCCLAFLAEALNPTCPSQKELEEALRQELGRYRKNRGGHVFLTGSTKVDFGNPEFLETQASLFISHQVPNGGLQKDNKLQWISMDFRTNGTILIGFHWIQMFSHFLVTR